MTASARKQILLVDDERLLTASAKRLVRGLTALEPFGLSDQLATANSGQEALALVTGAAPSSIGLVILDASLPDVYGIQLLQTLVQRAYPALDSDCRFVVWSSWECQEAARAHGAHGYISKVRIERHTFTEDLLTMLTALAAPQRIWYELGPFG